MKGEKIPSFYVLLAYEKVKFKKLKRNVTSGHFSEMVAKTIKQFLSSHSPRFIGKKISFKKWNKKMYDVSFVGSIFIYIFFILGLSWLGFMAYEYGNIVQIVSNSDKIHYYIVFTPFFLMFAFFSASSLLCVDLTMRSRVKEKGFNYSYKDIEELSKYRHDTLKMSKS